MKIIISLAISLVINLILMYINYKNYKESNYLKWSYKMPGGECMIEFGFGLMVVHKYSMRKDGENTHRILFEPITFIIHILLTGIIFFALIYKLV